MIVSSSVSARKGTVSMWLPSNIFDSAPLSDTYHLYDSIPTGAVSVSTTSDSGAGQPVVWIVIER